MILPKRRIVLFYLIFCLSAVVNAQTDGASATTSAATVPKRSSNTLSRQFQDLKEKANNYQEYKVIKENTLDVFWTNVRDSLSHVSRDLALAQKKIDAQKAELQSLSQSVQTKEKSLQENAYDSARISVLGISFLKENYVYLNWGIISVLLILLAAAIFKFRSSNKVSSDMRREYETVKQELNSYKHKLLEQQIGLGRELQTERNRIEELNQKIAYMQQQVLKGRS